MASWQADMVSTIARLIVKRRPEGGEADVVNSIRSMLELSQFFRSLITPTLDARKVSAVSNGSVKGEWLQMTNDPQQIVYYLHGGGYVACSPETHRPFTAALSREANARVFSLDYRLAPEHRFPAAVDDAVAGYRWLLDQGADPRDVVIGGDSAGGGLTLATLVALRDAGGQLPRAAFVLSPWADLACSGRSLDTNNERDPMFYGAGVRWMAPVYVGDASPCDPLASPIYADLSKLPPLLIHVSDTEVLLDDSTRLAERAKQCGVNVNLRVWNDLPHAWPILVAFKLPESFQALGEIVEFIQTTSQQNVNGGLSV
ncbi:MAG TPA: alpha/beta hydrolase [Blastocatellia bacterium]|nr:alpha/beta hydrolase [Blastocatellia bacterium]